MDGSQPRAELALGLSSAMPGALLQPPRRRGALTLDDVEIVIGEVSLLVLSFALDLLPVAFGRLHEAIESMRCFT